MSIPQLAVAFAAGFFAGILAVVGTVAITLRHVATKPARFLSRSTHSGTTASVKVQTDAEGYIVPPKEEEEPHAYQ